MLFEGVKEVLFLFPGRIKEEVDAVALLFDDGLPALPSVSAEVPSSSFTWEEDAAASEAAGTLADEAEGALCLMRMRVVEVVDGIAAVAPPEEVEA